jgi:hypothetical protein
VSGIKRAKMLPNLLMRRGIIISVEPAASLKLPSLVFLDGDECMVNNLQQLTSVIKLKGCMITLEDDSFHPVESDTAACQSSCYE